MSVATHLRIDLAEYDSRIRSFIPAYDEMLAAAAACLNGRERLILDLGVGTGALAGRCLEVAPHARVVGLDEDAAMLEAARQRLGRDARLVCGSFLTAPLPHCDAAVASLSLHHVRTRGAKGRLYSRLRTAMRRGGVLVSADCYPPIERSLAARARQAWVDHLRAAYSAPDTRRYLAAWAKEDVYVPLTAELGLLEDAGYRAEVAWRRGAFAVIAARPRP